MSDDFAETAADKEKIVKQLIQEVGFDTGYKSGRFGQKEGEKIFLGETEEYILWRTPMRRYSLEDKLSGQIVASNMRTLSSVSDELMQRSYFAQHGEVIDATTSPSSKNWIRRWKDYSGGYPRRKIGDIDFANVGGFEVTGVSIPEVEKEPKGPEHQRYIWRRTAEPIYDVRKAKKEGTFPQRTQGMKRTANPRYNIERIQEKDSPKVAGPMPEDELLTFLRTHEGKSMEVPVPIYYQHQLPRFQEEISRSMSEMPIGNTPDWLERHWRSRGYGEEEPVRIESAGGGLLSKELDDVPYMEVVRYDDEGKEIDMDIIVARENEDSEQFAFAR